MWKQLRQEQIEKLSAAEQVAVDRRNEQLREFKLLDARLYEKAAPVIAALQVHLPDLARDNFFWDSDRKSLLHYDIEGLKNGRWPFYSPIEAVCEHPLYITIGYKDCSGCRDNRLWKFEHEIKLVDCASLSVFSEPVERIEGAKTISAQSAVEVTKVSYSPNPAGAIYWDYNSGTNAPAEAVELLLRRTIANLSYAAEAATRAKKHKRSLW